MGKQFKTILRLLLALLFASVFASCKDDETRSEEVKNAVQYFDSVYVPRLENVPVYNVVKEEQYSVEEMTSFLLKSPVIKDLPREYLAMLPLALKNVYGDLQSKINKKYDRSDIGIVYKDLIIHYTGHDPNGKEVLLSGRAILGGFELNGVFHPAAKEILIAMPYTRTNNDICATESMPIEVVAGPEALVIVPDILGYGVSKAYDTPYIFNETAGREGYELAVSVVDYLTSNGVAFPASLKTYACGASQGGGYALAVHKMMESVYPKSGEALRFAGTYAASGAFDPLLTITAFATTRRDSVLGEPAALPMLYLAAKGYCPDIMKEVEPDMVMRKKLVECGLIDMVRSKEYNTDTINAKIVGVCRGNTPAAVLAETFVEGTPAYTAFCKVYENQSTLLKGWTPKTDIHIMFAETDESVPFDNFEALSRAFGNKVVRVPVDAKSHKETCMQYYLGLLGHKYSSDK